MPISHLNHVSQKSVGWHSLSAERKLSSKNSISSKQSLKNGREIKTFLEKRKLRKTVDRPALPYNKMLESPPPKNESTIDSNLKAI